MNVRTLKTTVAGFAPNTLPAHTHTATYLGEPARPAGLYRVVTSFADVTDPTHMVRVPMTPHETRAYAAWLVSEADHADYMNEGRTEDTEPRVIHPDDL